MLGGFVANLWCFNLYHIYLYMVLMVCLLHFMVLLVHVGDSRPMLVIASIALSASLQFPVAKKSPFRAPWPTAQDREKLANSLPDRRLDNSCRDVAEV